MQTFIERWFYLCCCDTSLRSSPSLRMQNKY